MQIRVLQFKIDNPGMYVPMADSMDEHLMRLDRYESLADIERMIATQQRIINEKKLELTGVHYITSTQTSSTLPLRLFP